jgi:hypothetical protein
VITAGILAGIAIAFGYASMPALIAASVPVEQTGIANGINSISRSVGSSIASAVVTSLLASKLISGLPAGVPPLPAESQFTTSFVLAAGALLLTIAVALFGLTRHSRPMATTPVASAVLAEAKAELKAEAHAEALEDARVQADAKA